jgi:hypothetical protein
MLSIALAGCGTARFSSTFEEDGTATHTLEIAFQRSGMTEQDERTLLLALADVEARADDAGLEWSRIDTGELLGVRLSNETENAFDAGAALNTLLNALLPNTDLGPIAPFQGTFSQQIEAIGGNEYDLQMTVDGDLLLSTIQTLAPGNRQLGTAEGVREVISIDYTATLPGDIKQTNGMILDNNTVRWGVPLQGVNPVEVTSTVGKDTSWFWLIVAVSAAAGLTILTAAIVTTFLLSRRRQGNARLRIAAAAAGSQEVHPVVSATRPPSSIGEVGHALIQLLRRLFLIRPHLTTQHSTTAAEPGDVKTAEPETERVDGVHAERD